MESSRQLKFRAWDRTEEKWLAPFSISSSGGFVKRYKPDYIVPNAILMQYTGLRDKNGVEGYHKDICYHVASSTFYSIEWIKTDAKFVLIQVSEGTLKSSTMDMRYLGQMEIRGNIYEQGEKC